MVWSFLKLYEINWDRIIYIESNFKDGTEDIAVKLNDVKYVRWLISITQKCNLY